MNCEAILPFLWFKWGAPNNGRKYTLLGSCTCGSEVCYDVTQTVFLPEHYKNLFSFILMLDNDCCAVEILWRNWGTDKRISKRSQNTRESENKCNSNCQVTVKFILLF